MFIGRQGFFLSTLVIGCVVSEGALAQQSAEDSVEHITVTSGAISDIGMSPKNAFVDGPFGKDKAVTDIARSLTSLSAEMLEQLAIDDLHDVLRVVPNTYAASGFGSPSLPTIRGQLGEVFQQSMRRQGGNNGFGIPLSFNSVGQLDVVKGAPSVILGTTQRNGGFVNLQNKKAIRK